MRLLLTRVGERKHDAQQAALVRRGRARGVDVLARARCAAGTGRTRSPSAGTARRGRIGRSRMPETVNDRPATRSYDGVGIGARQLEHDVERGRVVGAEAVALRPVAAAHVRRSPAPATCRRTAPGSRPGGRRGSCVARPSVPSFPFWATVNSMVARLVQDRARRRSGWRSTSGSPQCETCRGCAPGSVPAALAHELAALTVSLHAD